MQQVGSHQQDIVPAKARSGCWARGHWRCHTTSRATESAGLRLAFALCSPRMCYGCVGGTHSVPPLLSDAELFWRRNAFALLNAAGWVCSRVAFRGWKSDTGPGCKVKGKGQREVFPPHPPSAAGVSYPDVSAGAEHPVVALSPGQADRATLEATWMLTLKSSSYLAHQKHLGFQSQARRVEIRLRNCKSLQVY